MPPRPRIPSACLVAAPPTAHALAAETPPSRRAVGSRRSTGAADRRSAVAVGDLYQGACLPIHIGLEPLTQTSVSACELRFGKAHRLAERLRDLLVRIPFDLEKPHDGPRGGCKAGQSPLHVQRLR